MFICRVLNALLFSKTPSLLTTVYPECWWKVNTSTKTIYLTFDDGPIPEITPFVLAQLKQWNAKATFFCIGKNVTANPEIFKQIKEDGHVIGNHTYEHLNGWKTTNKQYFENIEKCAAVVASKLFRPPYGKLKLSQYRQLKKRYRIVMWDVLSFDFDANTSPQQVLKNVLQNTEAGSIVVMHDSLKARRNVEFALPEILSHFTAKGFKFDKLCI